MTQFEFKTTADEAADALSAEIKGKTVLITGPTIGGLAFEAARAIARQSPKLLILAGRNPKRNDEAAKVISEESPGVAVRTLHLDLASFASVREAAAVVNGWDKDEVIDVLINSAVVMKAQLTKTVDGFEEGFAVGHLGHFLFTNLIMDRILRAGPGSRIINVTAGAHFRSDIRYDDYNFEDGEPFNLLLAYGQTKTGNILFTTSLAEKLKDKGVLSFAPHLGGTMDTQLGREMDMNIIKGLGYLDENLKPIDTDIMKWKTRGQSASTTVVAAFDPKIAGRSGAYLADGNIDDAGVYAFAVDKVNAEKCWKLSEKLVGQEFPL